MFHFYSSFCLESKFIKLNPYNFDCRQPGPTRLHAATMETGISRCCYHVLQTSRGMRIVTEVWSVPGWGMISACLKSKALSKSSWSVAIKYCRLTGGFNCCHHLWSCSPDSWDKTTILAPFPLLKAPLEPHFWDVVLHFSDLTYIMVFSNLCPFIH